MSNEISTSSDRLLIKSFTNTFVVYTWSKFRFSVLIVKGIDTLSLLIKVPLLIDDVTQFGEELSKTLSIAHPPPKPSPDSSDC